MKTNLLLAATWGTGLVAGLFVAFAIAVMPALHGADARTFVVAMQRINVSIVNPLFLAIFMVAPVVLGVSSFLVHGPERRWALAGFVLTVVALVITFAVNIPLNDRLAAAGTSDPEAARTAFEHTWNVANIARTVVMSGSFLACLAALRVG